MQRRYSCGIHSALAAALVVGPASAVATAQDLDSTPRSECNGGCEYRTQFSSRHDGCAHFGHLDDRVRFGSNMINRGTLRALMIHARKEVVRDDY